MQKLFENWRQYRKAILEEAKVDLKPWDEADTEFIGSNPNFPSARGLGSTPEGAEAMRSLSRDLGDHGEYKKLTAEDLPEPAVLVPGSSALLRSVIAGIRGKASHALGPKIMRALSNFANSKFFEKALFYFLVSTDFAAVALTLVPKMLDIEDPEDGLGALEEWLVDRGVPLVLIGALFTHLRKRSSRLQNMRWWDIRMIAAGYLLFKAYEFSIAHPRELAGIGAGASEQDQKRAVDLAREFSR